MAFFLCRAEAQKSVAADQKGKKAKIDPKAASAVSAVAPAAGGLPQYQRAYRSITDFLIVQNDLKVSAYIASYDIP